MAKQNKQANQGLTFAIIFAAVVLSGSIVFFATQMKGGANGQDLQAEIAKGIDQYVKDAQGDQGGGGQQAEPTIVEGDFTDDDAVKGDADAPVTIVEFSDYECPFCAAFYTDTLPQIESNYIETGKVKLVYRDYPLSFHPTAYPAALFAECVRDQSNDDVYFKMHDQLFETMAGGFDFEVMSDFAGTLGINENTLKTCFDNEKFKDEIYADEADATAVGITGTPAFIVNGRVISGALPFAAFEQVIEEALAELE